MKDNKEVKGVFHRVTRAAGGFYGIETITIDKGKVTNTVEISPNYPTITLSKFGKQAFLEAQMEYDKASQMELPV